MKRSRIDRFIEGIELTAAGFLAVVTTLTFVSVFLRYFFAWSLPDAYDLSCLFLGILIFWGMAGAGYRGEHITVDLVWSIAGPRLRQAIDLFANAVTLGATAVLAWMTGGKVLSTRADNLLTFDVGLPVWIFYAIAWVGVAAAAVLLAVRFMRLLSRPDIFVHSHASIIE